MAFGLKKMYEAENSGGKKFLRLQDKDKVKVRFLQELDDDSKTYSPKMGVAYFTKEWHSPVDFKKQVVDTTDTEGASVGAELLAKYGWNGDQNGGRGAADTWRPKNFGYVNVLVDNGKDEPYVAVLKFNMAPKSPQQKALLGQFEATGSITDRWWSYSRKGAGQFDSEYTLVALDKDDFDVEAYADSLFDLEEVAPNVPYANQRQALGIVDRQAVDEIPFSREPVSAGSVADDTW